MGATPAGDTFRVAAHGLAPGLADAIATIGAPADYALALPQPLDVVGTIGVPLLITRSPTK